MKIEKIDVDVSEKLEKLSLDFNKSKGSVALLLAEKFFGRGVPHPSGQTNKGLKKTKAA